MKYLLILVSFFYSSILLSQLRVNPVTDHVIIGAEGTSVDAEYQLFVNGGLDVPYSGFNFKRVARFSNTVDASMLNVDMGTRIGSTQQYVLFKAGPTDVGNFAFGTRTAGQNLIRMVVANNGNVGIGTIDPSRILHINTVGKGTGAVIRNEADNNTDAKFEFWENGMEYWEFGMKGDVAGNPFRIGSNTSSGTKFEILSNGNVGIGRTNPGLRLEVQGDAGKTSGGNMWNVISDQRLKTEIQEYKDGLALILEINPVTFKYIDKVLNGQRPRTEVGVLAQDIQRVAPYMIKTATLTCMNPSLSSEHPTEVNEGEYLSYNGNALQYMLVNAIQEQQVMIDEKDHEINKLKTQLSQVLSRLDRLEEKIE